MYWIFVWDKKRKEHCNKGLINTLCQSHNRLAIVNKPDFDVYQVIGVIHSFLQLQLMQSHNALQFEKAWNELFPIITTYPSNLVIVASMLYL